MLVGCVGAGDERFALDRRVLEHRDLDPDRADETDRPELGSDLLVAGGAELGPEMVAAA